MGHLDDFTDGYILGALWSSSDPDTEEPLDKNHDAEDLDEETLEAMSNDAARFYDSWWRVIEAATKKKGTKHKDLREAYEQAGVDFWLTRNGHGSGFWDGDWSEPEATNLTSGSKKFGGYNLLVGDDGRIYGSKG